MSEEGKRNSPCQVVAPRFGGARRVDAAVGRHIAEREFGTVHTKNIVNDVASKTPNACLTKPRTFFRSRCRPI